MKTKQAASIKRQTIAVKDLKARKNPKGGVLKDGSSTGSKTKGAGIADRWGNGIGLSSY